MSIVSDQPVRNTTKQQYNVLCNAFQEARCRSCTLLDVEATVRVSSKENKLKDALVAAGFHNAKVQPIVCPQTVFPSRSKAKLTVSGTIDSPCVGLIDRNFEGIELLDCPLHLPLINKTLTRIRELISKYKIAPYDIPQRTGELKHLILKSSPDQSELIVRFVLRSRDAVATVRKAALELKRNIPEVKVVSCNLQPIPHAIVEGPDEVVLTDESFIWEKTDEAWMSFEAQTFSQVTPEVADSLYQTFGKWAEEDQIHSLLDLYCGVGGFSLHAAKHLERGLGLELSEAAIRSANRSAQKNGISNLSFVSADLNQGGSLGALDFKPDAIIVNPPRRGISQAIIEQISTLKPRVIYYSSCDYRSLLKDVQKITPEYELAELVPFDMFPLTSHMEVLARLFQHPKSC